MSTQHPVGENPQMPHSAQPVQAAATAEAVRRARNQATVVTCAAATVPTVLAMQGMASLAVDLLGFSVVVAIALAGFLELALISFALLTRASALAGRPGGVDAAAGPEAGCSWKSRLRRLIHHTDQTTQRNEQR